MKPLGKPVLRTQGSTCEYYTVRKYELFCKTNHLRTTMLTSMVAFAGALPTNRTKSSFMSNVRALRRYFIKRAKLDPFLDRRVESAIIGLRAHCSASNTPYRIISPANIRTVIDSIPHTPIGIRDTAALLLIYSVRIPPSVLVRMDVSDIHVSHEGMQIRLRNARGPRRIAVVGRVRDADYCPVAAVEHLLAIVGGDGPLFRKCNKFYMYEQRARKGNFLVHRVQIRMKDAGFPGTVRQLYISLVATATERGVEGSQIQEYAGYASIETVERLQRVAGVRPRSLTKQLGL